MSSLRLITAVAQRRAAQLFDVNQAVFDFLPSNDSDVLTPLLLQLGVNLARHMPKGAVTQLKALPAVKCVDAKFLTQLMKSEVTGRCLQNQMAISGHLWDVLVDLLLPNDDNGMKDLQNCHI